jgi:hypothetical protein
MVDKPNNYFLTIILFAQSQYSKRTLKDQHKNNSSYDQVGFARIEPIHQKASNDDTQINDNVIGSKYHTSFHVRFFLTF